MTEREVQDVIHALETLSKHKAVIGCESCAKTAEFALKLLKEQQQMYFTLEHDWRMLRKELATHVQRTTNA